MKQTIFIQVKDSAAIMFLGKHEQNAVREGVFYDIYGKGHGSRVKRYLGLLCEYCFKRFTNP